MGRYTLGWEFQIFCSGVGQEWGKSFRLTSYSCRVFAFSRLESAASVGCVTVNAPGLLEYICVVYGRASEDSPILHLKMFAEAMVSAGSDGSAGTSDAIMRCWRNKRPAS